MRAKSHDHYLEHEVLSASPEKLQLMLLEAAIRNLHAAKHHWEKSRDELAGEAIVKSQEFVAQLLGGLNKESNSKLVRQVASIYAFVSRSLAIAHLRRDVKALDDVLRVLEIERETWRQLCQQLGREKHTTAHSAPHFDVHGQGLPHESAGNLSFEA